MSPSLGHAMGWCTVTNLVPSGKVASTWISGIRSATPSMTSARLSTVLPSRAPSMMAAVIRATASGWLSFKPRALRRSASKAAVKISSLSFSRGVSSMFRGVPARRCARHRTCLVRGIQTRTMQETDHARQAQDATEAGTTPEARQRVIKVRRDYNSWVATETLEDYALRFTPRSARRWRKAGVANMAFGVASFLVLEAVGATLLVDHGFVNAFWAILTTGLIILLAGWPISVYAARHGVDMDLLTRGAGFGYIGSTITSLIYACFTFVFFALEAAVMAYALELAF